MKIPCNNFVRRNRRGLNAPRQSEGGSAVFLFIALLAIMMILVTANIRSLFHLRREVKLLEQQQIRRLNASQTNAPTTAQPSVKVESK